MNLISRSDYEQFVKTIPIGHCPLCHIEEQIALGESDYWYWIANISPYWKYHTMLIPKRHVHYFSELSTDELVDFQKFLRRVIKHLLRLKLTYDNGKSINQIITMFRESTDFDDPSYYKTDHLHVHLSPDERGVCRFNIDPEAINVDIGVLKLI